jgi:TRAP-type C4-dicarboxylate transport system substrate-binding protein
MGLCRRSFMASTLAMTAAPAIMRAALADAPPLTLKLHHAFSAVSSVHDKFLLPWARQITAQSGGRIRIDLFPSMQLGGAPAQLFDQAHDGTADIVWAMPSRAPGRFPKLEAFELPFVPSSRALVSSRAAQDYVEANAADEFRDLHLLCVSCSDRGVLHTVRPIHTVEDIGDMRLHAPTRLTAAALHALGAIPVPMPSAELPVAIGQHVVEGCVDPWHLVPTFRLNDVLKAHTEFADWSLGTTTYVLAMNKTVYDALPRELKAVIDANSGQHAATMAGTMWDLKAAAVISTVSEAGDPITTLLPEAVAHWRRDTEPVIAMWVKEMKERHVDGGKLLASARALLAKYGDEPTPQRPTRPTEPPRQQPEQAAAPATSGPQAPAPPAASGSPASAPVAPAPQPAATAVAPSPAPAPPTAAAAPVAPPPSSVTASAPPAAPPVNPAVQPVVPAPAPAPVAPPAPPAVAAVPPAPAPVPVPNPVPAVAPPPKTLDIPL